MNTSWLRHFATALALSTAFSACVIGDPDDDEDGFDDDGGESGEGGSTGGRAAGGGRGGTGGTAGSGGTATGGRGGSGGGGAGGTGEPTVQCEPGSGPTSTPAANCMFPAGSTDACLDCLSASCCSQLQNCYGTNPYNVCGYGGPEGFSEYQCIQECLVEVEMEGPYDEMDLGRCASECRTIPTGGTRACSLPGDYTGPVVDCMLDNCEDVCIIDPASE